MTVYQYFPYFLLVCVKQFDFPIIAQNIVICSVISHLNKTYHERNCFRIFKKQSTSCRKTPNSIFCMRRNKKITKSFSIAFQ